MYVSHPLGAFDASILAPAALGLAPPFANPRSATAWSCEVNHEWLLPFIKINLYYTAANSYI